MLEAARVDFVNLSGGTVEARAHNHKRESMRKLEAYFMEFAETKVCHRWPADGGLMVETVESRG